MPIHDLGYRQWTGQRVPESRRFWVIAETGIRLAWTNRWLRRLVLLAWLPAAYLGMGFFLLEQGMAHKTELRVLSEFLGESPQLQRAINQAAAGNPLAARRQAWAWLLHAFFRYPQGMLMALVVGIIAPPLIARDVQSQAFLLYFSRPTTRAEYLIGKLAVICTYVALISTLPALALYGVGVLLSPPEVAVIRSTWDLPLRILAASVVLILPTATLALAFSSLTGRSYFAAFAWFATWLLGFVAYQVLRTSVTGPISERWSLLSLYHTLGKVQSWVFGLPVVPGRDAAAADAAASAVLLAAITVISVMVVFRRISSPMRV